MKLLINFLQSHSGGARSYLRNILPCISDWAEAENMTVYVLLYQRQIDADRIDIDRLNIIPIVIDQVPKILKPLAEQLLVKKAINKLAIDTLFTPYQIAFPFAGVKTVSMLRNMEAFLHWQYPSTIRNRIRNIILQTLSKLTLQKSDLVIAVSDFAKDYLIDKLHVSETKIVRIYHGRDQRFSPIKQADDDLILKQLNLTSGSYIFTNGSILPYRKLETIIQAFSKSAASHDRVLIVTGDSNDSKYKALIADEIKRCGLENRIRLLGFIDIEKIIVLYRHAQLFITATEIEACPNIAIEAMASGCRVIASDKEPLPEMFQDNASYFKAGDWQNLADEIDVFFNSVQTPSSQNYDVNRFLWQHCADNTYNAVTQLSMES
ncbi:MAG: glycosyltransferase family 4 protein [Methylococcaceae bacterium]